MPPTSRFDRAVHAGFAATMLAGGFRYVAWHGLGAATWWHLAAAGALGALYVTGALAWPGPGRPRTAWILATVAGWTVLTIYAPSFGWCAFPLFFLVLRILPARAAVPVIALLAVATAVAQQRLAKVPWDPSPWLAPLAIAVMSTVVYRRLYRENAQRQQLIDDLVRTRDALAWSERAAGVLQERARLAQEIHDTIAQGLSSMHLLLNAADQEWNTAPAQAHGHVRAAAAAARDNLAEARRFVRDLAPPALDGSSLPDAVQRLCATTAGNAGLAVDFRVDGQPYPPGIGVEVALLRVAQGALANVVQHAKADSAVVTLTYLADAVTLDVCDDGKGFDPAAPPAAPDRGFGLRAIRQRIEALGGATTVESTPGEGTVLAVSVPIAGEPCPVPAGDGSRSVPAGDGSGSVPAGGPGPVPAGGGSGPVPNGDRP